MNMKRIQYALLFAPLLLAACGDSTTGTEPEPNKPEITTGTLEVTAATTGDGTDEDGYTVTLDDSDSQSLAVDGAATFEDLEEGSYTVELSGLANGCMVDGDNPVSVNVTANETVTAAFKVTCEQLSAEGVIAFSQRVDGKHELFTMNADGSNIKQLTTNDVDDSWPALSPDGLKIAFVRRDQSSATLDNEIWVIGVDGSNPTQLTFNDTDDKRPTWSPDNSQIAYESSGQNSMNIHVMNADGSNQTLITDDNGNDHSSSWSSDNTIAFVSDRQGDSSADIYKVQSDGTGLEILIDAADDNGINLFSPAWSHDGTQIAYQGHISGGAASIFIANKDGSSVRGITSAEFSAMQPSWSPDGKFIAFMNLANAGKNTTDAIWIITKDGSQFQRLTDDQGTYSNFPSWSVAVE